MPPRKIEVCGGDYEYTLNFAGVTDGVEVTYRVVPIMELFARMIRERAYEACEFSLANYIILKDSGAEWLDAIPVFLNRNFRHDIIYVRKDSKLREPADLRGCRVGVPDYSMTAAVWARGLLNEQYGVNWRDIAWHCEAAHSRFAAPEGARVTIVEGDLEQMLIDGEIDAFITTTLRDERLPQAERRLRRLIPDVENAEREYYRTTGIYPINHCVVIRTDVLERMPDLPRVLFDRYTTAKRDAYRRRVGATLLPWARLNWSDVFDFFGGDPIAFGLTDANRMVVSKLIDYLHEQNFISKKPVLESLFVPGSADFRERTE